MKAKIVINYDLNKAIEVFGIVFQVKRVSQYCKYPIGMQSFKSREKAKKKLTEVQNKLDNLSADQIKFIESYPINKHQYVKL